MRFPYLAFRNRVRPSEGDVRGGLPERLRTFDSVPWNRVVIGIVGVTGAVILWWIAALIISDDIFLPTPAATVEAMIYYLGHPYPALGEPLLGNLAISFGRILVGFVWGAVAGIIVGAAMTGVKQIRWAVDPLIEVVRPLPPLAFIPLLIVWFGIGDLPKVLLVGIGVFPIMVVSVVAAIDAVPEEYVDVALTLGASRRYSQLHVRVRAAMPAVVTGLRLAMGISWTSIVAVEMIAATSGLGYMILVASNYLLTPIIFAGIIMIGATALILDGLFRGLRKLLLPMG